MSGVGQNRETYQALTDAFSAYAKETYGDEYVLQDFVMIGYVVSMADDAPDDRAEYILATSTQTEHIITGLQHQISAFGTETDD